MEKIKFRGKRLDNGKWVHGDYAHRQAVTDMGFEQRATVGGYDVNPDTIGQFTGLCDKNGRDAYWEDIVKFIPKILNRFGSEYVDANYELLAIIELDKYSHSILRVIHGKELSHKGDICHIEGLLEGEIIGNIHDNPRLLKGGHDGQTAE